MTEQTKPVRRAGHGKLVAAAAILVGGVAAFYVLATYPLAVRWAIVLASLRARRIRRAAVRAGARVLAVRAGLARRAAQDRLADAPGDAADRRWSCSSRSPRWVFLLDAGLGAGRADPRADRAGRLNVALRWYVVHAYSNFEHKVSESLKERIRLKGLEEVRRDPRADRGSGRDAGRAERKSERKFFPGYVLVQMEMDEDTWHLVREMPKVLGFIGGTPEKPAPITDGRRTRSCAGSRKASTSRGRRCCSSRARWCA